MNVASFFSGVGGLDLGLERAGMRVVSQCEADPWRRRVLAERFPGVPITDDVRLLGGERGEGSGHRDRGRDKPAAQGGSIGEQSGPVDRVPITDDVREVVADGRERIERDDRPRADAGRDQRPPCDLVVGGVPCQDWSVAGKRAGIRGARSGLFFDWTDRIADELARGGARWVLFENVPGLLSASNGRDFGIVLATLAGLGYGLCWRILDARYFGVPQRRRRVFIVGHLGTDGGPAVRALGQGGEGDLAAGECSWQAAARRARASVEGDGRVTALGQETAGTLGKQVTESGGVRTTDLDNQCAYVGVATGVHITQDPISLTEASLPLGRKSTGNGVQHGSTVRRLTPVECERLMSWPDGWTAIDGPGTPDGRRYAACGDGVVSNVTEWIARRILAVDRDVKTCNITRPKDGTDEVQVALWAGDPTVIETIDQAKRQRTAGSEHRRQAAQLRRYAARARQAEALTLRGMGHRWQDIADHMGYAATCGPHTAAKTLADRAGVTMPRRFWVAR